VGQPGGIVAGDQAYLAQLRGLWRRNSVAAILTARLSPERIPPETAAIAARMNSSFNAQRDVNDAVTAQMGSLGIFGGGGGGLGAMSGVDPDEYMFNAAMGMVAAHHGNPPATQQLKACAAQVLRGEIDPLVSLEMASPQLAGSGLIRNVLGLAPEMGQTLTQMALFMAALAVPANEIPELLSGAASTPARTSNARAGHAASSAYAAPRTSSLAIASAALGVAAWLGFTAFASIPAIITGHMARREIRDGGGYVGGGGLALLGLIAGYLNLVITIVFIGTILRFFGLM
jgi:hypothetical protein